MRLRTFLAIVLLFAAPAWAATWTNGTQLVSAIIWRPGLHGFYTTNYHDPQSCGGTGLYLFDASLSEKETDRLYAMLLSAQAQGKRLFIWVDGCSAVIATAPNVTGLQINTD